MNIATKIQMAIHRHYDNIKLVLQFVIIGLIILVMINANIISDRLSTQGQESTAEIAERIDRETQLQSEEIKKQTDQLNTQFQALCFIIVQIAGEDALRNIDPPLEEQCRDLVQELRDDAAANPRGATPQSQQSTAPVPNNPPAQPVEPRNGNQVQPDPPTPAPSGGTPPPQGNQSGLLRTVDNLLNGLGL